jgi:hypothetical protein
MDSRIDFSEPSFSFVVIVLFAGNDESIVSHFQTPNLVRLSPTAHSLLQLKQQHASRPKPQSDFSFAPLTAE